MSKRLITLLFFLSLFQAAKADHITGGEMYYSFVRESGDLFHYRMTVKLFKDCFSNRQLINPTIISVFDRGTTERIKDISVSLSRTENISLSNPNKCITNPPSVCYEVGYYEFELSLPASANGYIVTCQIVFRISGISNLTDNYGSIGATYTSEIPATGASINNSAKFTGNDMVVVCANNSFSYSFAAVDHDADELRYSFCNAYMGGFFGGATATPAAAPPYQSVPYGSSFSGTNPLQKNVQIDASTGLIKGIAPGNGIYVVTVCVEEIRNGVVIATQRKDLQINISGCSIAGASLLPEYLLCKDTKTINLTNFSTSPLIRSYNWEILNDDGASIFNASTTAVSYTFPDTGIYRVKLVINKDLECSDSMVTEARVYPGLKTDFDTKGICFTKPTTFTNKTTNVYGEISSWAWDFGENNSADDIASEKNPSYQYPSMGSKNISLMVTTTKGCMDTLEKRVTILDKPPVNLAFKDTLICVNDEVALIAGSTGNFTWTPDENMSNNNSASPVVSPRTTTTYFVDLDDNGCLNRDSVKVRVTDRVFLQAMNDTTICQGDTIQLTLSSDAFAYAWNNPEQLSNPAIANPYAVTDAKTVYEVTARIGGCSAKDQVIVTTIPYPIADAGRDTVICYEGVAQLTGAANGTSVVWSPTPGLSDANALDPIVRPSKTTAYVLSAFDTKGCPKPGSDTVVVTVLPPIRPFAGRDTAIIVGQPLPFNASGGVGYEWSPSIGLSATNIADPVGLYLSPSEGIRYQLMVFNEANCADSAYVTVKVFATGPTVFVPNAFTPNGDGKNDRIKPIAVGMQRIEYFQVYNRWGQLVFQTYKNEQGWDGSIGGQMQRSDSFIWMVKAIDYNGKAYFKKGTLTLIR